MENKEREVGKVDMRKLPRIAAVDFDGTIVKDCYPEIGDPNEHVLGQLRSLKKQGWKLVLWTCRNGDLMWKAVEFCHDMGITFDAINQNIKEVQELFGGDTRKVYANIYIDDKAVEPEYPNRWREGL